MDEVIKSDLIVFYNGIFLVLIKDVCGFQSMNAILAEYAQKYGYLVKSLDGVWVNKNKLDYNKDIVEKYNG
jgi:hypothetical protein